MKAKVLQSFRDLKENVIRYAGSEFEVDDERFKDLTEKLPGFVEKVSEDESTEQSKKPKSKSGNKTKQVTDDGTA
ncbi:TPA: hypothetical protein ACHVI3_000833 [Streptococcus suis]